MNKPWDREIRNALAVTMIRIRNQLGLSQEQMADRSGLSRQYISLVERGKRVPNMRTIGQLTQGLGINEIDFYIDYHLSLTQVNRLNQKYRGPVCPISLVAEPNHALHEYVDAVDAEARALL